MTDTNQKLEDDVLRRMLATAPSPHKPKRTGLTPMKHKISAEPKPRRVNSGQKEGEQSKRS